MEDHEIVGLYWARAENAVAETAAKYGSRLRRTAGRVLRSPQDCEECVNDSYLALWNGIPPARPEHLGAYAGRVGRNLALKKYEYLSAEKRNAEAVRSLEELGDCVSGGPGMDAELEGRRTAEAVSDFLRRQPREKRQIFLLRYWHFLPIGEISRRTGWSESKVTSTLFQLRRKLRQHLEKEGIEV